MDVNAVPGCAAIHHLHPRSLTLWERIESRRGTTRLQPRIGFNSGKYDQIFPVVSERTPAFFQAMEKRAERAQHKHGRRPDYVSTAWHWLQMHILESPVKLLVCCLYQCFVSPAEHQPALGKVHAKSITQFLSAFLLQEQLSASCMPVAQSCNAQETQSLSLIFLCFVAPCCSPCARLHHASWKTCNNWLLWEIKDVPLRFLPHFLLNLALVCFPEFLEDSLSVFDVFPC